MKILTLSDLHWDGRINKVCDEDVELFNKRRLTRKCYARIKEYYSIVKREKPDLVLFAGDLTGDGSCGHGYQNEMKILLKLLEIDRVQSFFISGNHDKQEFYDELVTYSKKLVFSKDVSNQSVEFEGIRILGIPHSTTMKISETKKLIKENPSKMDIVLAHCPLGRRTYLFDFNTRFIITGHFDKKLTTIEDTIFISLDNDNRGRNYCVLDIRSKEDIDMSYKIDYKNTSIFYQENSKKLLSNERNNFITIGKDENKDIRIEEEKKSLNQIYEEREKTEPRLPYSEEYERHRAIKHLRGLNFKRGIERIRNIKKDKKLLTDEELSLLTNLDICEWGDTIYKLSKTIIRDYAGTNYLHKK